MTVADALWTRLKERHTAVSGLNSLAPVFLRESDSQENSQTSAIFVSLGSPRALSRRISDMLAVEVTMLLRTRRADDFVDQKALVAQVRSAFHDWTAATQDGWVFSPMVMVAEDQQPSEVGARLTAIRFTLFVNTSSSPYFGTGASFSGYSGGRAYFWQYQSYLEMHDNLSTDSDDDTWIAGRKGGNGVIRFYVTGLPPAKGLYTGVVFTLATGVTITRSIWIRTITLAASIGEGQPIVCDAQFVTDGESGGGNDL